MELAWHHPVMAHLWFAARWKAVSKASPGPDGADDREKMFNMILSGSESSALNEWRRMVPEARGVG